MPTAELLRLAEMLDGAGFAYLEVSGGGVFDTRRAARSREPLGADPRAQGADEDAARDGAPRSLPRRLAPRRRRLRAPLRRERGRERDRRLPARGPAERRLEPARGGRGDRRGRARVRRGPDLQPRRRAARRSTLVEQAKKLPELGAARVLLHDPSGALEPHRAQRARRSARRGKRPSGRPLLPGRRRQRARRGARGGARRRRPRSPAPSTRSRSRCTASRARRSRARSRARAWTRGVDVERCGRRRRWSTSSSATTR